MWRFGLILLAGCGFRVAGSSDGGADSDGPVDSLDGPAGDVDGDGIADATDNCPNTANPRQDNEDGDDRGDACDRCPHLPGLDPGSDHDSDGDGIGDQCDPRVGTDRRVVFLPFNDAVELDAFQLRAGSNQWSVSGGKLHQLDATLAVPQQIVWAGESIAGAVTAQTRLHIDSAPAGTGTRLAAVTGAYDDSGSVDAYACGVRADNVGATTTSSGWHYVSPPVVGSAVNTGDLGVMAAGIHAGETLKITTQGSDSTLDCLTGTTPAQLVVPGYIPVGYPGFRAFNVTVSFDYLFVVESGP